MSQRIVITGASSGIGAATALFLAKEGREFFLHCYDEQSRIDSIKAQLEEKGATILLTMNEDISSPEACDRFVQAIAAKTDSIDVLFNNAGSMFQRQPVKDFEWSLMEKTYRLNTFSVMYLTSRLLPFLEKGTNPCIITMTSLGVRTGSPTATIYASSKGALDAFVRGLAKEVAPKIRVNAIAPGVVDTPFQHKFTPASQLEEWNRTIPMKRLAEPQEIASIVSFFIEDRYITGETIDVNGGMYMR